MAKFFFYCLNLSVDVDSFCFSRIPWQRETLWLVLPSGWPQKSSKRLATTVWLTSGPWASHPSRWRRANPPMLTSIPWGWVQTWFTEQVIVYTQRLMFKPGESWDGLMRSLYVFFFRLSLWSRPTLHPHSGSRSFGLTSSQILLRNVSSRIRSREQPPHSSYRSEKRHKTHKK